MAFAAASTVSINPNQGSAGTIVTGSGNNWTSAHKIQVTWEDQSTNLGQTTVDTNGNFTVSFTIPSTAPQGSHTIYFVDATGNLGYFIPQTFTVTSTSNPNPPPTSTIDLQTMNIQSLQQPLANSTPTFRATIRNNGSAASGNFNIRWIVDGTNVDGGHYSIPAGATDTHDHIWRNITSGQHTLTFIANFDRGVPESDYTNNQFTLSFVVLQHNQLQMSYVSQFSGQTTQSEDCGPTSVLMVLSHYGKAPGGGAAQQITAVRKATQKTGTVPTDDKDLERALDFYRSGYSLISPSLYSVDGQVTQMEQAINAGHPVIVFVNGNQLDARRYKGDPGHWVVLTGYTPDNAFVYINDPDSQFGGPTYKVAMSNFKAGVAYAKSVSHIIVES